MTLFDESNFRIKSFNILPNVRQFFKQPTGERDLCNVDEIRRCLADIKPFSRLSVQLQNQILQEAWYECYAEQRTIIRQGDRAACFYMILSGTAVITYKRVTDNHTQTLTVLERGCTFGEKGLMTNGRQIFTVKSNTQLELLVLWKDDFKAIYMADDRYCSSEDLKFLKTNVSFLRGFPIDRLYEFPHAIQFCKFGLSEVIARDSRRMKHILVVKKGSFAVWKRLDPDGHIRKSSKHDLEQLQSEKMIDGDDDQDEEGTADNKTLFSEIQLSGDTEPSSLHETALDIDLRLTRLQHSTAANERKTSGLSSVSEDVADLEKHFPGIVDKRDRLQLIDYDQLSFDRAPKVPLPSTLSKHSQRAANSKSNLILPSKMLYLHIKTINEGQSFGLTDMLFPNQPTFTLVSNECECLLLRKSSFVRIASDQYKHNIRRTEIPFPSDSVFYNTYHMNEEWKRYSKEVYKNACDKILKTK
ncbi:unnamed protein product [Adineta ricciae]|uniref:Cyclic nucleotide-binding domain-containing protein n=1 Tax=Adineta ricciae TaxID=249248 RepID=A0A813YFF5_ADIRI|nr:unnamed protein product [Adineta ricciae]CAF0883512.1 unnamed protein product [Adineta ricciae]